MIRAELEELLPARPKRQRRRTVLRAVGPTLVAELQLKREVNAVLLGAARLIRKNGLPIAEALKAEMTVDVDLGWFTTLLRNFFQAQFGGSFEARVGHIFSEEEKRHRGGLASAIRASHGIDLSSVFNSRDVRPHVDAAVERSVTNIRGIGDETVKRITNTIVNSASKGERSTTIAKELAEDLGISSKRAKFIARNEVATLNGTLNKVRQKQVGIEKYVWSTSLDERVRPEHQEREGETFSWSDPPADGHPGEPINCRCVARAIIPGLDD